MGGNLFRHRRSQKTLKTLKHDLKQRGEASNLFAQERGDSLESLFGNLNQTIFGKPAYPSLESKAAHLLYFVIKDPLPLDGTNVALFFRLLSIFFTERGAHAPQPTCYQ